VKTTLSRLNPKKKTGKKGLYIKRGPNLRHGGRSACGCATGTDPFAFLTVQATPQLQEPSTQPAFSRICPRWHFWAQYSQNNWPANFAQLRHLNIGCEKTSPRVSK
jgi:hypothetical protein